MPSKLECLHFGTWDSNKEWLIEMSEDEEIEAIALGDGFAVCITSKKFVRLFTISGIQCEVFLIPGFVVCCSARGSQLLIVYHKGSGIDNDQCLNMMIVKVNLGGHSCVKEYFLPLSSKSFLSWLGFTDEGTPCIVDTSGIVSVLSISCGTKWIPVADTSANLNGKSSTYFVLGLSEIKQEIRCILCKGSKYPSLLPRPNVAVLPFSLPFCELSTDKGRLEEENQRYALTQKCIETLLKEGFDLDSELNGNQKKRMDVLLKMFAVCIIIDIMTYSLYCLSSYSKEDSVLKPKPLSRMRGQPGRLFENEEGPAENGEEINTPPVQDDSLMPKSSPLSNPFKTSKIIAKKVDIGSVNGIDEILSNSMIAKSSNSIQKVLQPKKPRFQMKKNSVQKTSESSIKEEKFGFDLFLEENKEEIKASASPDIAEKELIKLALKMFKELPKVEKQKYLKSSSSNGVKENVPTEVKNPDRDNENDSDSKENSCHVESNSPGDSLGKRKGIETDHSDSIPSNSKKMKSSSDKLPDATARKLTQFYFTKTRK
ncbi:WD repeat and HMG-box DNA-binding protein 1 [Nephila pilipes]|uniref:WD repeat and HMG-box DNA-binding protein 1 n=1 Tax=Nephila pilipes TaxID=299642 RepID=A0A8X6N1J3_NEPPI|nr:WD repeat and HMG-box DNA-binding protein 1 [Nephila pilipes]